MEQSCLVSLSSNPVKFLKELLIKTNKQNKPGQSFLLSAVQRAQLWYNALSKHWRTEDWLSEKPEAQLGESSAVDFVFLLQGSISLTLLSICQLLCLFANPQNPLWELLAQKKAEQW